MQLQTKLPNDAVNGSKWMIFRMSGKLSFATLIDGVLYNGGHLTEDDFVSELDVENNYEGDGDAVTYYALIGGQTEEPSVGITSDIGVNLDGSTYSRILQQLDAVNDMLKKIPVYTASERSIRYAKESSRIIDEIKIELHSNCTFWSK